MKKMIIALISLIISACVNNVPKDYYNMEFAELQNCAELTPRHGYVVEQTYEGYAEEDDYYIVNIDGNLYEVESDDLQEGDKVTCYFVNNEEIVRTLYEWR